MSELAIKLINEAYEKKSEFLDLGNCGLEEIPREIVKLKDTLQHLNFGGWYNVSGRYIQSVNNLGSNFFGHNEKSLSLLSELPSLKSIYLYDAGIWETGVKYISALSSLTTLGLNRNKIRDQGAEYISRLSSLRSLHLSTNEISDKGAEYLSRLSSLTSLDLENNRIKETGAEYISRLSGLTYLNLGGNKIFDKGAGYISRLSSLKSLNLRGNKISEKGFEYISRLSFLTFLNLTDSQIGDQSAEYISRLTTLTSLNLTENVLSDQSAEYISRLSSLTVLNLSINQIGDQGAKYISRLSSLTVLNLSINQIGDQGAECISRLPLLTELNLAYNKIVELKFIKSTVLKNLCLQGNLIETVSLELIKNVQLEVDVNDNNSWGNNRIYLQDNPIKNIPPEVLNKGRSAIIEYLEAYLRPLNECKLIFVGDGSVGKTSLMKSLVYREFNKSELTTHGINKIAWKGIKNDKGEPIKINCWDFGGQHIQHSLHQFFFTERVVYVLVLNPRNDEKAGYWLDQIDKLGRNSQLILVYNWKDKEDKQADFLKNFRELRKTYKYLPEPIILSCATGEGMANFKAAVKNAVLANEGLKIKYPEKWFYIKEKLETRIPIEKHYIEYSQYETWCKEEEYNEPEQQRNLLRILDSVGSIVFFDKPVLNELQVLNPEWITTGAYAILTSEITREKKGHLTWEDLRTIFSTEKEIFSDKTIRIKYEEPQFKFILQLMHDYCLCQENPLVKHEYLIPVAFGEKPDKDYDIAGGRHYRLKFESPFEMLIIHRFIAKNILNIVSNDYWNSGIYFKHASSTTYALVDTNQYSQVIDCWIKGENIRGMWEVIRNDFREIVKMYHNFLVDEEVEYTAGERTVFLKYEEMIAALRNGVGIIPYDPKTGLKDIDVNQVLELFDSPVKSHVNMDTEKIKVEVNPQITINPQFNNYPIITTNQKDSLPGKEQSAPKVHDVDAENQKVKKWKNKAVWAFVFSTAITIGLILIWYNNWLLDAVTWSKLDQYDAYKWACIILGVGWNSFIIKSLYDRFYDPSKVKAYRENLRK
jgi:internalin A